MGKEYLRLLLGSGLFPVVCGSLLQSLRSHVCSLIINAKRWVSWPGGWSEVCKLFQETA